MGDYLFIFLTEYIGDYYYKNLLKYLSFSFTNS